MVDGKKETVITDLSELGRYVYQNAMPSKKSTGVQADDTRGSRGVHISV